MILEDKKFFIFGKRHPDPVKYPPILEAGYLMIKDE